MSAKSTLETGTAPKLVLGTVQLGLEYGIANRTGMPDHQAADAILDAALAAGIETFDTARAYGISEARLGERLGGDARARFVTKLSPLPEIPADAAPGIAAAAAIDSLAQSLAALRRTRIDVLLLHRAAHRSSWNGAVWDLLRRERDAGRIGALGVSASTPAEALEALGDADVVHLQIPFNVLDRRWEAAGLPAAVRERGGVTIHARSALLQGLLADVAGTVWPNVPGVDAPALLARLRAVAAANGLADVADLAVAFVRAQDWIDGIVLGAETPAQLRENAARFARPRLDASAAAALRRGIPECPAELLDPSHWTPFPPSGS